MEIKKVNLTWTGTLRPLTQKIQKLVMHHMAHPTWTFEQVHAFHQGPRRGWHGIGYNYWVAFDGTIYEGRGENIGAHAHAEWNPITYGIGFQGDFDANNNMTDAQVRSGAWICKKLMKQHGLSVDDIVGHKDVNATACPGRYFRMADLKAAVLTEPQSGGVDLKRGDRGISVERWQNRLMQWNKDALPGYGADGSFGPETVTWTNNFKSEAGHPADGVVDALTWDAMIDALQVKPTEFKVGATVTVNGRGWSTTRKEGQRTTEYTNAQMKIARIHDSGDAPYGMERGGWIVGWFDKSQLS